MRNISNQKLIAFGASVMLTIALIYYIAKVIDWQEIVKIYQQAKLIYLLSGFVLTFIVYIPLALRWAFLLGKLNVIYKKIQSYKACLAALFAGLLLPGSLGGDALRIWLCKRDTNGSLVLITTALFIEKIIGVLSLLILIFFGIKLSGIHTKIAIIRFIPWLVFFACLVVTFLPLLIRLFPRKKFHQMLRHYLPEVICNLLSKLSAFRMIKPSTFYVVLGYSIITQLLDVIVAFCLAQGLSLQTSIAMVLIALPASYFTAAIPFSIGGLGIREGTFIVIFALFGVPLSEAVILALVVFLNRSIVGLTGGGICAVSGYIAYQKITNNK